MRAAQAAAASGAVGVAGIGGGAEELGLVLGSAVDVDVVAQPVRPTASAKVARALTMA